MDAALRAALGALIGSAGGSPAGIAAAREVAGGSSWRAVRIEGGDRRWFVKLNDAGLAGMFTAEADGLGALAACPALRVPRVVGHGVSGATAYLMLEFLPLQALRERAPGAAAGKALATLHRIESEQ